MNNHGARTQEVLELPRASGSGPTWVVGPGPGARSIAALAPLLQTAASKTATATNSRSFCIVPALAAAQSAVDWTAESLMEAVADPLVWTVREIQTIVTSLMEAETSGRIVIVLPSEETMGVAGDAAGGAVCGGILSMARTLSLELGRKDIAVNVVCVDPRSCSERPDVTEALHGQLELLLREDTWITGQEIWVTGGTEAGRMRP